MNVSSRQAFAEGTGHAKRYFTINVWLFLVFEPKNVPYPFNSPEGNEIHFRNVVATPIN